MGVLKDVEGNSDLPSTADSGSPKAAHPEVVIHNCSLETPSGKPLVQQLNLVVERGTSVVIMGPSGVGKSSLLRAIAGLWEPSEGSIALFPHEAAQHDEKVMESVVRKCVNLGHIMRPGEGVNTTGNWRKQLSGGEKQRLAMARLLLAQP